MSDVLIIDAGLGNIGSVINSFERMGANVVTEKEANNIDDKLISHIVLPGVGTYKEGMKSLNERGWLKWITENTRVRNKPMLGICLGMQLMSDDGTEGIETGDKIKGLGLIGGSVEKIRSDGLRLPHIGWNEVIWKKMNNNSVEVNGKDTDYYFVHSYHFVAKRKESIIGTVEYGEQIVAAVRDKNIIGVQFHPEKSQKAGAQVIKNFLTMV